MLDRLLGVALTSSFGRQTNQLPGVVYAVELESKFDPISEGKMGEIMSRIPYRVDKLVGKLDGKTNGEQSVQAIVAHPVHNVRNLAMSSTQDPRYPTKKPPARRMEPASHT